jgi:Rieske Fe-S protein
LEPRPGDDRPHLPPPTLWPVGFAIGVACILVGLVLSWVAVAVGGAIAVIFGFLWVRDVTGGMRAASPHEPEVVPDSPRGAPPIPAHKGPPAMPEPAPGERFPRSKFLEGATLGLGAVIGGVVTVPPLVLMVAPTVHGEKKPDIDLGALDDFPAGKFVIATFVTDPKAGDVSRRTAYIRNNGLLDGKPSLTIISNRCVHLGCPVQAQGLVLDDQTKQRAEKDGRFVRLTPTLGTSGFGCPCHGGAYDKEGNRTAGPPVRALDRYSYSIKNGRVILGDPYSVAHVRGEGKDAKIKRYSLFPPGQHVDGWEGWLWPIPELR